MFAHQAYAHLQSRICHSRIAPTDDLITPQQGQRVIAELAFGRGGVGFKAVVPAPKQAEAAAIPNDGVEGGEQAGGLLRRR